MSYSSSAKTIIAAINLISSGGPLLASEIPAAAHQSPKQADLNLAAVPTFESTWLQVPIACKARGINADPNFIADHAMPSDIQNIYANYDF